MRTPLSPEAGAIIGGFAAFFVGIYLISAYLMRNKRLKEEDGLKPIAEVYCGISIDGTYQTTPFVRVSLYEEFFVIRWMDVLLLRYEEVTAVAFRDGMIAAAVELRVPCSEVCLSGGIKLLSFGWEPTFLQELFTRCGVPVPDTCSD